MAVACIGALAGCLPDGVPFVEVASASEPDLLAAELLADRSSTALDARRLGAIARDVGAVRYDGDAHKRVYLFTEDLRAGARGGSVLHLPQQPVPWPASAAPLRVDVRPFDPSQWTSARVYDVGLCSVYPGALPPLDALIWQNVATGLIQGLDAGMTGALAATRTEPATFTPVLRSAGTYDPQGDRLRFEATYLAPSAGGAVGCDEVTLRIRAELGWEREPAVVSYPPQRLHPTDPGGSLVTADGRTWDFPGVVHALEVRASSGGCVVLGEIEDRVAESLRAALPESFRRAILDGLLVDPALVFDVPVEELRPCTCDTECSDRSPEGPLPYGPPGRRHRCKITDPSALHPCGECWIQLDPDRLHARPEGLELVVAEDASDPQVAELMRGFVGSLLCAPGRLSRAPGRLPLVGSLPGALQVPPGPPDPVEPSCRREGR